MPYYFLPEDLRALDRQIDDIERRIRETGREMGLACQEGAETFHDNFAWEDGDRQQRMWTRRLRELRRIRDDARVVEPAGTPEFVRIGRKVRYLDLSSGTVREVAIGSYLPFGSGEVVAYSSPLGRILVGARVGADVEGDLGGRSVTLKVLAVWSAEGGWVSKVGGKDP